MGSCYSGDQIAEDHIHTDIATCDIEEPQQKYRLGTVSDLQLQLSKLSFSSVLVSMRFRRQDTRDVGRRNKGNKEQRNY